VGRLLLTTIQQAERGWPKILPPRYCTSLFVGIVSPYRAGWHLVPSAEDSAPSPRSFVDRTDGSPL